MVCSFKGCSHRRGKRRSPTGAIIVLVAVALVILFVAAAISVDVAYMFLAEEQLRVASDAASKAAVVELSRGGNSQSAATAAINCAAANRVCGKPMQLSSSDVSLGRVTYSQVGTWDFVPGGTPTTAAQVTATASLPLVFAPMFGTRSFSPSQTSTAAFVRNKWCLVVDCSGSMCFDMNGIDWSYPLLGIRQNWYPKSPYSPHRTLSRMGNLYVAGDGFLTCLSDSPGGASQNLVGLVTFGDSGEEECTFTSNYSQIRNRLSYYVHTDIRRSGVCNAGTNLAAGLQSALDLFAATDDHTPWNKIIVVFSDGQWNNGVNPVSLVPATTSANTVIYSIGLFSGSNNSAMRQIATQTGGQFYYATSGSELQDAFRAVANTIPVILTQ